MGFYYMGTRWGEGTSKAGEGGKRRVQMDADAPSVGLGMTRREESAQGAEGGGRFVVVARSPP